MQSIIYKNFNLLTNYNNSELPNNNGNKDEINYNIECNNENAISSQNIESLSSQEKLKLSSWGLPERVLKFYESKGITQMFQWQLECLTLKGVLDAGNLVYSAPTSAGKTLVAEILISKTIFELRKKALIILPFVSVVREKMFYFQGMYSSSGIHVEGFMGGHTPSISFNQVNVAVCTIEKANSIINHLLENGLQNLGLVVVDELHLLGDPYRGYLLELLLTKLKYLSINSEWKIQIVGMSATLPNLKSLADWLNGQLFYTNFRPIPLNERLKCGNELFDKKLNKLIDLPVDSSETLDDSENIGQLCVETIKNGHSVLIFCPTKVWCENLAEKISLYFKINGCSKSAEKEGTIGWILRKQLNLSKINEVIEFLKMSPTGLDKDLHKTILYGVAFHHAGLTLEERDIIEGSFRQGSIRVLCCTSTLSSGVNLPARRVIIRSPISVGGLMDVLTYHQMIGRAGRMGKDSEGESILICKPNEKALCQTLMCSKLKPIESCLGHGRLSASLKRALLEIIASGIASNPEEVQKYASCTFLAFSSRHNISDPIKSCISFLEENEFIRLQENGSIYAPTPLGKACLASSLPPDEGLALFNELQRARRCFVLDTDLHIIYQVTPYSVSEQWSKIDWLHVLNILEGLPPSMKRVGEMVGIEEEFLVRVVKGRININDSTNRNKLSIYQRFYTSLALQDLINEIPLSEVALKYECNKGMLQSLQQSAATYAGMVTEFTKCLGWSSVELIFSQFQERLQFGIKRELCELMRLPLLNAMRARVLFNAGFTNLSSIANANITDLENVFFSMVPFQSKKEIAGETKYEKEQRNKMESIWITGKADLTIREAAEHLSSEARNILILELGLESAQWGKKETTLSQSFCSSKIKSCIGLDFLKSDSQKEHTNEKGIIETNTGTYEAKAISATQEETKNKGLAEITIPVITEKNDIINIKDTINNVNTRISDRAVGNCDVNSTKIVLPSEKNKVINTDIEIINSDELNHEKNNIIDTKFSNSLPGNENFPPHKTINESKKLTGHGKESFNFTSSSVFDMIPDHIEEFYDSKAKNRIDKIDRIKDSESVASESESVDSLEILYDSKIENDSQSLSFSRLSEDLFEKGNSSNKKMSTPIQNFSNSRSYKSGGIEENRLKETGSPDLFSQSLTFDTQLGRILDFKEPQVSEKKPPANPSTSFNSDDLGFVSDLSPPKSHLIKIQQSETVTPQKTTHNCTKSFSHLKKEFLSPPKNMLVEGEKTESLKRKADKIDSPDLIMDSDESMTENRTSYKRLKCSLNENAKNNDSPIVVNETINEKLLTPKLDNVNLSNLSKTKCLNNYLRTIGSQLRRSSQKTKQSLSNKKRLKITNCKKNTNIFADSSKIERINFEDKKCKTEKINWNSINIIDVCENKEKFRLFYEKIKKENIVGLALGCRRKIEEKKNIIGSRIVKKRKIEHSKNNSNCHFKEIILDGIAFYWEGNDVFYMSLDDEIVPVSDKFNLLESLCQQKKIIRIFDVKEQIKMLQRCCSISLNCSFQDPKVGFWLLAESWREKSFSALALHHFPSSKNLVSQLGSIVGFSSPGLLSKSGTSHKIRASLEAYLTYHIISKQLPLLREKGLERAFVQTEMPIMLPLAEMELQGFKVCRNSLMDVREKLDLLLEALEKKAYSLSGQKFSMASSAAISKVLFKELGLGKNSIHLTKKKKIPSISKEALQELGLETKHPLPELILQWRKIRSILSKFVSPLIQITSECDKVLGISQTYTTTGRISMFEPNLQNIPKNFIVNIDASEVVSISLRGVFTASDDYVLVSVDYCQIELRMLAHLSEDADLIKNINDSADIFINIAATIFGVPHYDVDENLRQKAKQTCYGIIYGIGSKGLSQQLGIDEQEAAILLEDFKNKYEGVKSYLENLIKNCKKNGFITTILGRRRYLPAIKDLNLAIRAEAERQAINTTIQGSAADFVKTAMITWREKTEDLLEDNKIIRLLLHLHDELIFEIQKDSFESVIALLKETMENAMELIVPTPVKIKTGFTWGELKNFESEQVILKFFLF